MIWYFPTVTVVIDRSKKAGTITGVHSTQMGVHTLSMCPQRPFKFVYLSDGQTFNPKLFARPSDYGIARVHPLELDVQFDCLPQARTLQSSPEDYCVL
jgi:hypothetical protein